MELHKSVFYNNVPTYIRLINKELSKKIKEENLGKHIKVLGGYAFKSTQYQSSGIPIIRISDFQNEKIDLSTVKYYEESKECDKYALDEGDIIIAMTGGTIGKLGIVQKGLGKLYLNQRVGKFQILDGEIFYDRYVYWIARGVQDKVKNMGYGGAQPNVSGKQIEALKFPIPTKEIQIKIVEFLTDLRDDNINGTVYFNENIETQIINLQNNGKKVHTIIDNSEKNETYISKLRQAILSEAIQGKLVPQDSNDEPASILLEKIKTEKEKLIKEKKIRKEKPLPKITEEEIPYELPKGWEWCRFGNIGDAQTGTTPSTNNSEYFNGEIPFIKPADIFNNRINYNNESLTKKGLEKGRLIPKDSLMMVCIGGSTGKSYFSDRDVSCNQQINTIKGFSGISGKFIFYFTNSKYFQDEVFRKSTGSATNLINKQRWIEIIFPLPPLNEQKRIVEKVDQLMKLCDELESQVKKNQTNSEKLMGAVLREAFENEA